MYNFKSLLCAALFTFAGSASAWETVPANVVEDCTWQYVNTYRGIGVWIVEYRSTNAGCPFNTKLYDYRVRQIRYH
ncbi:hypothetical protein [Pseudoalteromonas luteoviolacea]|uniref:Uncharacterized protein n=1 Tax=Pseudoalteromonas luteoviolacea DSM 6061 TaxID=1365250 RepID=A0A161ZRT6_9GAMM|nr:hypothetical protein [Pseudoalteromonas luteoviolacea]KZN29775.1 hypothetical protein N475_05610 [Pseudoalteromonas luteoviolacea DSM 6061]KZN55114.1 hypothetical protein N474_16725 [Pseudoalteromonas luteoviolacea CPMOR-2]MBE0389325.1 hypothetical protein [Pseudoalteromonas luteoviolacea DSM 6061]TQF67983.1 hypothetical protein FLM44_22685 [Pseudoalteromonas luteoviolacea]